MCSLSGAVVSSCEQAQQRIDTQIVDVNEKKTVRSHFRFADLSCAPLCQLKFLSYKNIRQPALLVAACLHH